MSLSFPFAKLQGDRRECGSVSEDELVAAIDKHLVHEALVKSRRDAFHIVDNDKDSTKSIPQ